VVPRGVLYSVGVKYAIQATVFLARHPGGAVSGEIARDCGMAPHFMANILNCLTRKKILSSSKGSHGGYLLRRDPADIRLADLVEAVDEEDCSRGCAMGHARCSKSDRCAMHDSWQEIRARIETWLQETTVAQLARAPRAKRARVLTARA
jgi:Rrf2 family transcriptional regulator, iron-sulfur cluster assembly transcription factor